MANSDTPRKGAQRIADIPPATLDALNRGELETLTLAEILGVDFGALAESCVGGLSAKSVRALRDAKGEGVTKRMAIGGRALLADLGIDGALALRSHRSDLVRGWVAYAVGGAEGVALPDRLEMIRPLADDPNPGVREWAWIGVRARIGEDVERAIALLTPWTGDASANIRRFASESTRPRGVWCAHIRELRENPERGLPLLAPLRDDPTKYVQDSVANWLNDASKDRPEWVVGVCEAWTRESPTPRTARIVKRATRTLAKGA